jgi:diacylglycerol kinase family enzyme
VRRLAAVAALLLVAGVVLASVILVLGDPLRLVLQVVLAVIAVTTVWVALTRAAVLRWLAALIAVAAVLGIVLMEIAAQGSVGASLIIRLLLLAVAAWLARYALGRDVRSLQAGETPGVPVPAARHGALIMNLKSGGGKAERFHLVDECRRRGIKPIVLQRGDDLLQLARDAIDGGADVVGMAGGDGSQALVASIAAARGVPMVVIPSGTRNHFALDLGLDRNDVVGALDAYGPAVERTIDLGDVNGRVFVNNVSMGVYAVIVESPEYRDAKMETSLAALPGMLGPESTPFDLRFTDGEGVQHEGAHVIQVSNNPYGSTLATMATRARLDTGELGVFAVTAPGALGVTGFLAQLALGHPERADGYLSWSAPRVQIDSGSPIPVGLDGESLTMDPPLLFASRPGVLRVRLPLHAIGYSPAAIKLPLARMLGDLWRVTLGRPVRIGD